MGITEREHKELDSIYERYGYIKKEDTQTLKVYVLPKGMYHGAEIVVFNKDNTEEAKRIKESYSNLGYAAVLRYFKDLDQIETDLFRGFFNSEAAIKGVERTYARFRKKVMRNIGDETSYSYIEPPYSSQCFAGSEFRNSSSLIQDVNTLINREDGPSLIIIEAPAGFGKTCTAYEILNSIPKLFTNKIPFFTELSRNRQAKIFKYVLLSEMENEYQHLNSELVSYHIKTGRIPIIIDGFDELLSKTADKGPLEEQEQFNQVETMLSTIAELLQNNAKVVLTSRKTAIFSGESFTQWIDSFDSRFNVIRFVIDTPNIKKWITIDKYDSIKRNNIPIKHIANPVLLSYLRYADDHTFNEVIADPEHIVDKYFDYMLTREQERQDLAIEPKDQLVIFQKLALLFAEFNITSEDRDFLKESLIDYNREELERFRLRSPNRPSLEELANTLTNHALLDRIGVSIDNIGFINEFVFGLLLGDCLADKKSYDFSLENITESFLELVVTSYSYKPRSIRYKLWTIIKENYPNVTRPFDLVCDIQLRESIHSTFKNQELNAISFDNIHFKSPAGFELCVFNDCEFIKCKFDRTIFNSTSFLACRFKECSIINSNENLNPEDISTFACEDYNTNFLKDFDTRNLSLEQELEEPIEDTINWEEKLLGMFFQIDGKRAKMRPISLLKKEFTQEQIPIVDKHLHKLKKDGYLIINGNKSFITQDGIGFYSKNYRQ